MTEKTFCPQCRSEDVSFLLSARDHLVSGETYTIDRCRRCGLAFTVNPPSEDEIHRYYVSDDYISHSDKKNSLADYFYHIARGLMLRKKYRLVAGATGRKTGNLIDIGSGTGYFASFMQKKGWTVTGIELNDKAREYSVTRFAVNAVPPSELSEVDELSVECITFWHVLEHLYDPGKWLSEVNRILKDEGRCLIALPNLDSADARWYGNRWAALDVPRHLWHFSPEALVRLAEDHGFTCDRILPMPLDIFYISALGYKNEGRRLALARGLVAGLLLTAGSLFRKNSASSLIYVLSKRRS